MRSFVIGFGPARIKTGIVNTIETVPQSDFLVERFIVPSIIGECFAICRFNVDGQDMIVSERPIPALAFSEFAMGNIWGLRCPAGRPDPEWAVIEVHKGYLCFCLRSEDAQRIVDALNRIEES
jgi:hypothetical protein